MWHQDNQTAREATKKTGRVGALYYNNFDGRKFGGDGSVESMCLVLTVFGAEKQGNKAKISRVTGKTVVNLWDTIADLWDCIVDIRVPIAVRRNVIVV